MRYPAFKIETAEEGAFAAASDAAFGAWVRLVMHASKYETGGSIKLPRSQPETWMRIAKVSQRAVSSVVAAGLAEWSFAGDLVLLGYSSEAEAHVLSLRGNGKKGGRPPNHSRQGNLQVSPRLRIREGQDPDQREDQTAGEPPAALEPSGEQDPPVAPPEPRPSPLPPAPASPPSAPRSVAAAPPGSRHAPQAPQAPGPAKRAPAASGSLFEQMVAAFRQAWRAGYRREYQVTPADKSQLGRLLQSMAPEQAAELPEIFRRYLGDATPFVRSQGHSLSYLCGGGRINAYRVTGPPRRASAWREL